MSLLDWHRRRSVIAIRCGCAGGSSFVSRDARVTYRYRARVAELEMNDVQAIVQVTIETARIDQGE